MESLNLFQGADYPLLELTTTNSARKINDFFFPFLFER